MRKLLTILILIGMILVSNLVRGQDTVPKGDSTNILGDDSDLELMEVPVELLQQIVYLDKKSNTVVISLKTATEDQNDYFSISRSKHPSGLNIPENIIGTIDGGGTRSSDTTYYYYDYAANPNEAYYYKIKQVDFNGESEEFNILSYKPKKSNKLEIDKELEFYPTVLRQGEQPYINTNEYWVYTISGQLVFKDRIKTNQMKPGYYILTTPGGDKMKFVIN